MKSISCSPLFDLPCPHVQQPQRRVLQQTGSVKSQFSNAKQPLHNDFSATIQSSNMRRHSEQQHGNSICHAPHPCILPRRGARYTRSPIDMSRIDWCVPARTCLHDLHLNLHDAPSSGSLGFDCNSVLSLPSPLPLRLQRPLQGRWRGMRHLLNGAWKARGTVLKVQIPVTDVIVAQRTHQGGYRLARFCNKFLGNEGSSRLLPLACQARLMIHRSDQSLSKGGSTKVSPSMCKAPFDRPNSSPNLPKHTSQSLFLSVGNLKSHRMQITKDIQEKVDSMGEVQDSWGKSPFQWSHSASLDG